MKKKQGIFFLTLSLYLLSIKLTTLSANEDTKILPQKTRAILSLRNLPVESLSVHVVDIDSNDVILSWNAMTPKNPASVMKILTTAVALDELGPTYQ